MTKEMIRHNLTQIWFNVQKMDKKERKKLIKHVLKLNYKNGSFIEFAAKDFLKCLIKDSECYFNGKGYTTPVKEFEND